MKNQILTISMIATANLIGEPVDSMQETQSQNQYCDPCDCCTNTRPCVDCECYTPQFYNLQCDWGFSFDAEFLYWYARETKLAYGARAPMVAYKAQEAFGTDQLVVGAGDLRYLGTSWKPGFRIGVGFNSSCDGWDYNLTWTWFQNKQRDSTSVEGFLFDEDNNFFPDFGNVGQSILINPWINQSFSGHGRVLTTPTFDRIRAKYHLTFNQIDLDLGRKYWLSECFNLRPFTGVRGVWTRTKFSTISERDVTFTDTGPVTIGFDSSYKDAFKTDSWAVGLIGGLHPTWYFSSCFALHGQIGAGVLWGAFELEKRENYDLARLSTAADPNIINFTYVDSRSFSSTHAFGVLDLGIGLRWERTWCCDRYRSALDLGWEHHIFFDQNHRYQSTGVLIGGASDPGSTVITGYNSFVETTGNLGFGGLVVRLNFDF